MFLPEVAYYSTNNPNHVFFLSFLKECFHTISPKISFFTSTSPRCLIFAFDWLQASISSYFTALLPIRRLSFLSHMQVPFFWIRVFVNILQLSFSIYFFSDLNMVIRSSNSCFSLSIYRGTPPYDHPVYTTASCLSSPPIVFPHRHENLRVILLFWRPSTGFHCIFFISVFHIVE